jgi:hypothetical protein
MSHYRATPHLVSPAVYLLGCHGVNIQPTTSTRRDSMTKTKSKTRALRAKPAKGRPPAPTKPQVFHVLLRVRTENGQTINAHKDVIARRERAVLGKMGEPLGSDFRSQLNQQIEAGTKTYLFLTTREGWNGPYVTDRCSLQRVYDKLDPSKYSLVPPYYANEIGNIRTWFEIVSIDRLTRDEMNKIFVLSSGKQIMSAIASSATVFRVGIGPKSSPSISKPRHPKDVKFKTA